MFHYTTQRHEHRNPHRYFRVDWDVYARRWRCSGCGHFVRGLR